MRDKLEATFAQFYRQGGLWAISVFWALFGVAYAAGHISWPVACVGQIGLSAVACFKGRSAVFSCFAGTATTATVWLYGIIFPSALLLLMFIVKIHADIEIRHHVSDPVNISGTWLSFLLLAVTAAPIEELIFRGWLQTRLRKWGIVGIVMVAALFWAVHGFDLSIAPLAGYLSYLRERFQSLSLTIAAHLVWNVGLGVVAALAFGR